MPSSDIANYSVTENLRDGRQVTIRAIRSDDKGRIADAFREVSPKPLYHRTFSAKRTLSDTELKRLAEVDLENVAAFVSIMKEEGQERIVGGGRYIRSGASGGVVTVEVAFHRRRPPGTADRIADL